MCRTFGMAVVPFGVFGQGKLQTRAQLAARDEPLRPLGGGRQSEAQARMSATLETVVEELKAGGQDVDNISQVALAFIVRRARDLGVTNCFPVVGTRKTEQLEDSIKALDVELTDAQMEFLQAAQPLELGFPYSFVGTDPNISGKSPMLDPYGWIDFPAARK